MNCENHLDGGGPPFPIQLPAQEIVACLLTCLQCFQLRTLFQERLHSDVHRRSTDERRCPCRGIAVLDAAEVRARHEHAPDQSSD